MSKKLNRAIWFIDSLRQKIQKPLRNKTQFIDLNVDCKLLILEQMDFASLLSIAQVGKSYSILAADVFRWKFSMKTVILNDDSWLDVRNADDSDYEDSGLVESFGLSIISKTLEIFGLIPKSIEVPQFIFGDTILITKLKMGLTIFKHFGNDIKKLRLFYNYLNSEDSKALSKHINKYCGKSLEEFEINHCSANTLEVMLEPFERVKNVTFGYQLGRMGISTLPLNQLFPQLRRLSLNYIMDLNERYINCHLPHLEHLYVHVGVAKSFHGAHVIENKLETLIKRNPQIQSLTARSISPRFFKTINKFLPNLEYLAIYSFFFENERFHFDKVKKFTMKSSFGSQDNITFSHLEELSINCFDDCDDWFEFLGKHQTLTQFHIEHSTISDQTFEFLAMNLENLLEMSISLIHSTFMAPDTIINFLVNHRKIEKFTLGTCKESDMKIFVEHLGNGWNIEKHGKEVVFLRRN